MVILLTIVHVFVCLFLILVVLLQSGKAGDLASAFGGMGSQTAFGPRGAATALSKATTIAAVVFMLTSISLAVTASRGAGIGVSGSSVLESAPSSAPATPAAGQESGSPAPAPAPEGGAEQPKQ